MSTIPANDTAGALPDPNSCLNGLSSGRHSTGGGSARVTTCYSLFTPYMAHTDKLGHMQRPSVVEAVRNNSECQVVWKCFVPSLAFPPIFCAHLLLPYQTTNHKARFTSLCSCAQLGPFRACLSLTTKVRSQCGAVCARLLSEHRCVCRTAPL